MSLRVGFQRNTARRSLWVHGSIGDVVGDHFFEFVTAHGPFELTAIALAAGAGLRLGVGLFATAGLTRLDSVRENASRRAHYVRLGNAIRASCFYRGISIALACSLRHQGHVGDLLFGID